MSESVYDIDAAAFADWIGQRAGDRLWTVDGEEGISGALRLPCLGTELASLLRSLGGKLRLFGPEGMNAGATADVQGFAEVEDGGLVFEVAWLSGNSPGAHWVLAEDTLAEAAAEQAAQSTQG